MSKPKVISPDYDSLPKELIDQSIWLTWGYRLEKTKEGIEMRWSKVPHGTSTDPATWKPLREIKDRRTDGVALALGFRLCGIDLDCCFDEKGEPKPWARAIVELFPSYVEVSPSGTGLHILFWASEVLELDGKLRGGKERLGWEIGFYVWKRYWCMTGRIFENRSKIETFDVEVIRKFHQELSAGKFDVIATNGSTGKTDSHAESSPPPPDGATTGESKTRFAKLMAGDWEGLGYPSQSEAD